MTRLRPRSVYDVLAAVAFFLLLAGGGAYAAATATIGPNDIQNDAVLGRHIKDGQVQNADLAPNSIGDFKMHFDTLTPSDFKAGAIPLGALSFDRHLTPGGHDTVGVVRGLELKIFCATQAGVGVKMELAAQGGGPAQVLVTGTKAIDQQLSDVWQLVPAYAVQSAGASADTNVVATRSADIRWVRYQLASGYGGSGGCNFGGLITPLSQ